jgi:hypothetical protein
VLAAAVEAFYLRDQTDLKACLMMQRFIAGPTTSDSAPSASTSASTSATSTTTPPPPEYVYLRLRFTRCLYAQLLQQHFQPPKVFKLAALPAPTSTSTAAAADPKRSAQEIGVKVACGLEILYQQGMWWGRAHSLTLSPQINTHFVLLHVCVWGENRFARQKEGGQKR